MDDVLMMSSDTYREYFLFVFYLKKTLHSESSKSVSSKSITMSCFRSSVLMMGTFLILHLLRVDAKEADSSLPVDPNMLIPITGMHFIKGGVSGHPALHGALLLSQPGGSDATRGALHDVLLQIYGI